MAAQTIPDHIRAAFRLAGRDAQAVEEFANVPAAVWFSFAAAIIALPLFFTTLLLSEAGANLAQAIGELGPYAVGWLLFPVVMAQVVVTIDRERYYCRYIAAVNWCALVEYLVLTALVVIQSIGVVPEGIGNLLFFAVVIWVLFYQHFVARHALQIDGSVAALIVGLRLVLDLVVVAVSGIIGG